MTTVQADFVYVGSPQLFSGWSEIFAGVWQAPDVGVVDFGTSVCDGHAPADGEIFVAFNVNVGATDQWKQQIFQVVDCGYHVVLGLPVNSKPTIKRAPGYEGGAAYVTGLRVYAKNGTLYAGQWLSLLTVPPVLLDQDAVTWRVDNIYPPTMNNAWTGRGIGNDTYAVQKTAAADFLALYPDFPTLDQATQDAIIADLNRLMAQVMGNAVITHAPGYGGTVTTAPNTGAGFDLPIPSFVVMVDGAGAFSSLWWKSGIPATAWVQVAGVSGGGGGGGVTLSSDIPLPDGIGNAGDLASGQATAKGHIHPANPAPPPPALATSTLYTAKVGASLFRGDVYCPFKSSEVLFPCYIPDPTVALVQADFVYQGDYGCLGRIFPVWNELSPGVWQDSYPALGSYGTFASQCDGHAPADGEFFIAYNFTPDPGDIRKQQIYQVVDCGVHVVGGSTVYSKVTVQRAADYQDGSAYVAGLHLYVRNGLLYAGKWFHLLTAQPITLDTTDMYWEVLSSYTPSAAKSEILSTNQLASEGAPTTLMVADSPAWSTYEPNGLQIGPTFTSKPIGHTSIPAGPFGASLLLRNSVSATTFAEVRWWIKHVDDTTDAPFLSLWSSPIVDTYDSVYDFQTNFAGLTILATDRVECGVFAHGANDPHTGVVLYWTFQDSARTSRFTVTWQGNETYGGPFSNASLWHIEPPTNVVWMFREGWVACLSNGPIDPSTDSYGILIHLKGGVTIRAGLTSALDGLVLRTYTLAQLGYYNQEIIGIDGVLTGADKSFQLIGHFAFTAIDLSEVPEPVPTPEIGPLSLDFGGDLSAARSTPWVAVNSWSCRVSLGIGWPAGIIGAIGCELSGHGLTGTAGAPLPLTGLTQPAGTAATALVAGIRPKGASFIRFTWTPGVGNSGTGKSFTDESGVNGRLPTLGQP
jgi:hypothetical protein